jgi:hypothetical protein
LDLITCELGPAIGEDETGSFTEGEVARTPKATALRPIRRLVTAVFRVVLRHEPAEIGHVRAGAFENAQLDSEVPHITLKIAGGTIRAKQGVRRECDSISAYTVDRLGPMDS